jgi:hypothetical protein
MKIPGYNTLTTCPKTPGCISKQLFQNQKSGELFDFKMVDEVFKPHNCRVRGSQVPLVAYMAEWENIRTGRKRFVGPKRLERSVERCPNDLTTRAKDWKLVQKYVADIEWRPI